MSHAHHLAPQSRRALRVSALLTGIYFGVELVKDRDGKEPDMDRALAAVNALRDQRILISATGADAHILKIRPPLVFKSSDAGRLLEGVDNALRAVQI